MRRELQQSVIQRNTRVSLERELALFKPDSRPLNRTESAEFMATLQTRLGSQVERKTEVVEEVAPNAVEIKICLSTVGELREDVRRVYAVLAEVANECGVYVLGCSQPTTDGITHDTTHFMTLDVFKATIGPLAATNSLHLHFGGATDEELVAIYNAGNRIAPIMLAASQCAVIDGRERGRANSVRDFFSSLPPALAAPWTISNREDFENGVRSAIKAVEMQIGAFSPEYLAVLASRYPDFIGADGRMKKLSPDKIFHPTRLRFDKVLPELGLVGSAEFRPIDAQPTLSRDLAILELAIGLLIHETAYNPAPLSREEIGQIMHSMANVADFGMGAIMWNGLSNEYVAKVRAMEALMGIGLTPQSLHTFGIDGGASELAIMSSLSPADIIRINHARFMKSVE
ncbi:Glutamate--cysteine ligase [Candidatus Bilamarchaeum dharawalense]|uniref:Glutamate--cysteine ligase n=1 Tax=Candidatus Bilamarchaeum dharawalense TaxID=2885759 RepID=A0A5E4LSF0_9ARCH|nr:Glutamate--cysteine ligase [Candidatus Bilamarchaeum dharawalense]